MRVKMADGAELVISDSYYHDIIMLFFFILERLIKPSPILYNRSTVKEKNVLFEDIFTGAHHYFLKVQGQPYILAGGLNNFHQIGTNILFI